MTAAATGPGIVDSHHHVWDLAVRDQDWISGDELAPPRREFTAARPVASLRSHAVLQL